MALKDGVVNTLGMKFLPVKGTDVLFCIHEVRYKDYAAYAADVQGVDGAWTMRRKTVSCGAVLGLTTSVAVCSLRIATYYTRLSVQLQWVPGRAGVVPGARLFTLSSFYSFTL